MHLKKTQFSPKNSNFNPNILIFSSSKNVKPIQIPTPNNSSSHMLHILRIQTNPN